MKIRESKGITLIALVVSIIILLILAGVAIGLITEDRSLISYTQTAKDSYNVATIKEKFNILIGNFPLENVLHNKTLLEYLNEQKDNGELDNVIDNEDGTFTIELNGYKATVNESNLTISDIEKGDLETSDSIGPQNVTLICEINDINMAKINLTFGATDESGIASYTIYNGEQIYDTVTTTELSKIVTKTLDVGTYSFRVVATDTSNNNSEQSNTVNVVVIEHTHTDDCYNMTTEPYCDGIITVFGTPNAGAQGIGILRIGCSKCGILFDRQVPTQVFYFFYESGINEKTHTEAYKTVNDTECVCAPTTTHNVRGDLKGTCNNYEITIN